MSKRWSFLAIFIFDYVILLFLPFEGRRAYCSPFLRSPSLTDMVRCSGITKMLPNAEDSLDLVNDKKDFWKCIKALMAAMGG